MPQCFLRTDADEITGFGHFSRCSALARKMGAFDFQPVFVVKHCADTILSTLDQSCIPFIMIPRNASWEEEAQFLAEAAQGSSTAIILDISHSYTLGDMEGIGAYTKRLSDIFRVVVLLDGLARGALITLAAPEADLVVTPYCGARNLSPNGERGFHHLTGPGFMVFQNEYTEVRNNNRPIAGSGRKVLVTFGGSDPQSITLLALQALSMITEMELEIRVVIGPAFKDRLKSDIKKAAEGIIHKVTFRSSPATLAREMVWCDLAISSTGLTKYELALTGTPAVFLSIDEEHHFVNREFNNAHTGVDLGLYTRLTPDDVKTAVLALLDDAALRYTMSRNGLNLVDLHGAEQILSQIRRLYDA
jgi:UDP-2,4-diacetamido-2,4,6-trideoxy-beta-L-altropyranose hydrolase